jgi:hypothetical protein
MQPSLEKSSRNEDLHLHPSLAQTRNAVAFLPLAALLQNFNAFETLEHVTLSAERAGPSETTML